MIYQCYECKKLFDEDYGVIVIASNLTGFLLPINQTFMAFKCKNCMSEKGRKVIERIQNERKKK